MTVLAHDVEGYRRLGRLVAGARAMPSEELRDRYQTALFAPALATEPSTAAVATAAPVPAKVLEITEVFLS